MGMGQSACSVWELCESESLFVAQPMLTSRVSCRCVDGWKVGSRAAPRPRPLLTLSPSPARHLQPRPQQGHHSRDQARASESRSPWPYERRPCTFESLGSRLTHRPSPLLPPPLKRLARPLRRLIKVDILGNNELNEAILEIVTGNGHAVKDVLVSKIVEFARKIRWDA
jgi:hypothetical protein